MTNRQSKIFSRQGAIPFFFAEDTDRDMVEFGRICSANEINVFILLLYWKKIQCCRQSKNSTFRFGRNLPLIGIGIFTAVFRPSAGNRLPEC